MPTGGLQGCSARNVRFRWLTAPGEARRRVHRCVRLEGLLQESVRFRPIGPRRYAHPQYGERRTVWRITTHCATGDSASPSHLHRTAGPNREIPRAIDEGLRRVLWPHFHSVGLRVPGAGQAELLSGQIGIQPAQNWKSVGLPTRRAIRKAPTTEIQRAHGQAFGASAHAAWRPDMGGRLAASNSHQCPDADVRVRLTVPQPGWSSRYLTPQKCVFGLAPAIVVVLLRATRLA